MTALAPPLQQYRRNYEPNKHTVVVVAVWQDRRGEWTWRVSWYGVSGCGIKCYQFRGEGEAGTLRAAWQQVRRHYRVYSGGRDIVRDKGVGR